MTNAPVLEADSSTRARNDESQCAGLAPHREKLKNVRKARFVEATAYRHSAKLLDDALGDLGPHENELRRIDCLRPGAEGARDSEAANAGLQGGRNFLEERLELSVVPLTLLRSSCPFVRAHSDLHLPKRDAALVTPPGKIRPHPHVAPLLSAAQMENAYLMSASLS